MGSRPTQYASSVSATISKFVFCKIGDVNCEMTSQGGVTTIRNNAGRRMFRLEFYSELNEIEFTLTPPTTTTTTLEQKVSWVFMALQWEHKPPCNNKVDSHSHFRVVLCWGAVISEILKKAIKPSISQSFNCFSPLHRSLEAHNAFHGISESAVESLHKFELSRGQSAIIWHLITWGGQGVNRSPCRPLGSPGFTW